MEQGVAPFSPESHSASHVFAGKDVLDGYRKIVALMGSSMSDAQEALIRQHTERQGHIIVMLDENPAGMAGRADAAARLSQHCFVRTHMFDKPDAEPEHLTAEEVRALLPL